MEKFDDLFVRIGSQAPKWGDGLCEHPPKALPERILPLGSFRPDEDFQPLPELSTAEDLKEGVRQLREKAIPFLHKHAPPIETSRKKYFVTDADWRLVDRKDLGQWQNLCTSKDGWESVRLPHYGGPVGPATTMYRSRIDLPTSLPKDHRIFLHFQGADYIAQVFLNGIFVMQHEGLFDPFEADVTAFVRPGINTLIVRLDNEHPSFAMTLQREMVHGEKLYAATGPGWDDPEIGWHHCPPGMGIYQEVYFEIRPAIYIHDLWVRPLPDTASAEMRITIHQTEQKNRKAILRWKLFGSNFKEEIPQKEIKKEILVEPGMNTWRIPLQLPDFRWWDIASPWLYQVQVSLCSEEEIKCDMESSDFGMRTFRISEEGPEKGRLFLNNKEIRLRGANTMGHEQQCVLRGDLQQLEDDILIAKFAGLNFLRITQRPVQPIIYEICDRLGILLQTDLPLFGKLVRTKVAEGVRQAGAMERLIRSHASCILVSFINEPSPSWTDTANKHLLRDEFMGFLRMCAEIVLYENPDRQIKPIDGDYEPPSPGLPDQHSYCGWYCSHGLDLGKLHRGYWMPTKPGWKYACGEFGVEGMDSLGLMQRHFPQSWLPEKENDAVWTPLQIPHSQTGWLYTHWMDAGKNVKEWIKNSQSHQAWVIRTMTRAFRRDSRMVSFALHLLIDAFPASWMKTVVDYERNPKPAYFAYRDALRPLLADIRCDRWAWWSEEIFSAEAWICNDESSIPENYTLRYLFILNDHPIASGSAPAEIHVCESTCQGRMTFSLPKVESRTSATLRLAICRPDGSVVNDTQETFTIFPHPEKKILPRIAIIDQTDTVAQKILADLPHKASSLEDADIFISSDPKIFPRIHTKIESGATLLLLPLDPGEYTFGDVSVTIEKSGAGPRQFVSCHTSHPAVRAFEKQDFRWWFDAYEESITALLDNVLIASSSWEGILSAPQASSSKDMRPAYACAERKFEKGRIIICQIHLAHRLQTNPPALLFLEQLLSKT